MIMDESLVYSKPIKKRVQGNQLFEDNDPPNMIAEDSAAHELIMFENRARADLVLFLSKKGIDAKASDHYKVHVKLNKKKASEVSSRADSSGFSVTYSCPHGSILFTKTDVLNSILDNKKRSQHLHHKSPAHSTQKRQAYESAKENLSTLSLPKQIDNFRLINLGHIDRRSSFHNVVQIYPIGYKCEQVIGSASISKGITNKNIVCEIGDLDGYPEFKIVVKATGDTFLASTEANVWKKVIYL
jgi:hypothetical protein